MNQSFDDFMKNLESIKTFLNSNENKSLVNEALFQQIEDQLRKIKENSNEILAENRNMRIGIIGQVKAGKSSFLNALIFNGEDVLPHAATPMTASLTKIVYAEEPYAKVVYFSDDDWKIVENKVKRYDNEVNRKMLEWEENYRHKQENQSFVEKGLKKIQLNSDIKYQQLRNSYERNIKNNIDNSLKAFKEIHEIAEKSNVSPFEVLGKTETISIKNIQNDLEDYIGASGTHTPFVKYIELGINNDMLAKGIEIVDTPGMGDPIISRGETTKNFLMKCDLVFVLSPSSQFLNKDDIQLIKTILPQDNIQHAVLLGTKFDSVLLDDPSRTRSSLLQVMRRTCIKLNNQAQTTLNNALDTTKNNGNEPKALKQLQNQKPEYISSLLYNAGKKILNHKNFNELENQIIQQMNERFDGMNTSAEFLIDFSNIENIREKEFKHVQEQKDIILKERRDELFNSQYLILLRQLDDIQTEAEDNLKSIKTEDITSLSRKLESSNRALRAMRRNIRTIFEACGIDVKKYIVNIAVTAKSISSKHEDINIKEISEQKRHREKHGWWIFGRTDYWTETIYHSVASVSNVIDNINHYITALEQYITHEINFAVNIDEIRKEVKEAVLDAFLKSETDFDENDILGPVNIVLQKITIPPFTLIDRKYYIDKIISKFSSAQVQDEQIHELKQIQSLIISEIETDMTNHMEKISDDIKKSLDEKSISFTDEVQKQIEEKITMLTKNIQDKETNIKRYKKFLKTITEEKEFLRTLSSKMNK
ncbi:hypothetical protein B5F82_00195 [Megamonas hypermegale]|uniref:dynamin family protein n=1 Tax=Megamonas hypermegale TaxID=158847 RepID=UPI000B381F3C|nr:dynamin family protein [Megamonas hypermegale]OUO41637.1 hypothetical protein B5F82_00195 [Megamonas hypermegale]